MDKKFLYSLLSTNTPSGNEVNGINEFGDYLKNYTNFEFVDKVNNYAVSIGSGDVNVMLSAHIDEIALRVQYIDENGFIYFIPNGHIDNKVLLGATVTIISKKSFIKGVIGKKPIHIEEESEDKMKLKTSSLKIDCGFESKEDAIKNGVSIGNHIMIDGEFVELSENRFKSKGCDDKVGVFVVAEVMKRLSKYDFKNIKIFGVCCTQEETTFNGAVASAQRIDPQYSIDIDVTFATDDGYVDKKEWGDVKLGEGCCIVHSPDCNEDFVDLMKNAFIARETMFQEHSLEGSMTNTNPIKQSSTNCENALITIPIRNMHTQVEVCDYRDLESAIIGISNTIFELENINYKH